MARSHRSKEQGLRTGYTAPSRGSARNAAAAPRPGLDAGRTIRLSLTQQFAFVALLHLAIGCAYSGTNFFRHFGDAVPWSAVGHGVSFMPPGDQYEQLNRYTMAGRNLLRGHSPYYEGFQYNISKDAPQFSEGWVFFPFSLLGGLLALPLGDAAAFNTLLLLSYPLAGLAMFGLVRRLTGNFAAALLASLMLATLPFRTAFLYGELLFGVDLFLLPLLIWAFERFVERRDLSAAALVGAAAFCILSANIQLTYYLCLFGAPYFAVGLWRARHGAEGRSGLPWARLMACLAPAAIYVIYLGRILGESWKSNQPKSIQESFTYAPSPVNMLRVFNGNEKNLFLGAPLLLLVAVVAAWGLIALLRASTADQRRVWYTIGPMFLVSYVFCFGPNLDSTLRMPIYTTVFLHIPGASATRTPGRIMGVTGVASAILFGLACDFLWRKAIAWRTGLPWVAGGAVLCAALIVVTCDFLDPSLAVLDRSHNAVYESIRGTPGRVLAVPFQSEPDHYLNATFIYYAQRYDLKMFNGHSSFYTPRARAATQRLYDISATGELSEEVWNWLKQNDYRYIIAHGTRFEPKVSVITLANLMASPYLRLDGEAGGIYKFTILPAPRADAARRQQEFNRLLSQQAPNGPPVLYLSGWYDREVYPGQQPFRWMKGTHSALLVAGRIGRVQLDVRCPYEDLRITAEDQPVPFDSRKSETGWAAVTVALGTAANPYRVVELTTGRVYQVPTDPRRFGCMVGDVTAR